MDTHYLKIFYESCNTKSFTKAAKKLYISQSAVSIQIKKLEQELGTQLIERNSKNFKLTFAGKELYRMSKEVFDKIKRLENEMKKIIESNKSKVVVGATHNIGEPILPSIIIDYRKLYPELEFDIYIKNKDSLLQYLKDGIIDVILMESEYIEDKEINVIDTEKYPFVMVASEELTSLKKLKDMYLLKREDVLTSKYIDIFERKMKFNLDKKMQVNGSIETLKHLVKSGEGFTILPYYCVHEDVKKNKLHILYNFSNPADKFQIIYLKENENKYLIRDFINFLKKYELHTPFKRKK